jgi:hypothetical protein
MRHNWQVRFFSAVMAVAVWAVMSMAGVDFCLALDQVKGDAQVKTQAKAKVEKTKRKKRPAAPRAISLFQGGFDPTTPLSPEADLKNRLNAPIQPDQADQRRSDMKYDIGEKLRLTPGAAPAPAGGAAAAGGGVRASWQSKGNMAVSGGVGYDTEGRAKAGSPSPAGPSENASPGPAAGVMLKYSF